WWRKGARRCSCSLSSCRIAGIVVTCLDLQILAALEAVGIEARQQRRALAAVEPAGEKLADQGPQKKAAAVAAIGLDESRQALDQPDQRLAVGGHVIDARPLPDHPEMA